MDRAQMKKALFASKVIFGLVLLFAMSLFAWWFRSRPTYLLYQIHSQKGEKGQTAVLKHYERLLKKPDLEKQEEISLRLGLSEFYLEAVSEMGTVLLGSADGSLETSHPFLDKTKRELNRVLELAPKNGQAHYLLGRTLLFRQLVPHAKNEFKIAIESDPTSPFPLFYLAKIYLDQENLKEAQDTALQALALNPQFDLARWILVQVFMRLGEEAKVKKEYEALSPHFKSDPDIESYMALYFAKQNKWDLAKNLIEEALKKGSHEHWVRYNEAEILMLQGEWDQAKGTLLNLKNQFPSSPWPYVGLTQVFQAMQECSGARQNAAFLQTNLPRWPWSYMAQAWSHLCEGEHDMALQNLDEALSFSPQFWEASELKAQIYLDTENDQALGELVRPWLDQKRHESLGYTILAERFFHQSQFELAEEMAESALQKNPSELRAYIWKGFSQLKRNKLDEAQKTFEVLLSRHFYDVSVRGYCAYFLSFRSDTEVAIEMIGDYLDKDSRVALLWFLKGKICEVGKNESEAEQAFRVSIELKPYLLRAYLSLADIYWKQGKKDLMENILRQALKVNASHPDVLLWRKKLKASL